MPIHKTILETLRTIKPKDLIYPGIFLGFIVLLGIVFYNATHFISVNINKVFSSQQNTDSQALDLARYTLVAKKLNIPVIVPSETIAVPEVPSSPEALITTAATTIPATPTLDKKLITITVANSTTIKGLAAELAKEIKTAGFNAPKTETQQKLIATTTILIKESKYGYAPLLLETVLKSYPQAITATTTEDASTDVLVIIGTN